MHMGILKQLTFNSFTTWIMESRIVYAIGGFQKLTSFEITKSSKNGEI